MTTDVYNLKNFRGSRAVNNSRKTKKGTMSVIYSEKGKRLTFSKEVLNLLKHEGEIQISYSERFLAISESFDKSFPTYTFGNRGIIYNTELVKELVAHFNLDFTRSACLTFKIDNVKQSSGKRIVYIKMKPEIED